MVVAVAGARACGGGRRVVSQIVVPVPPGTKSRDLNVDIRKGKLIVGLKGKPPLIDGALHKQVIVDDCMWTLEDSKEISISLQKEDKMNWRVVVSSPPPPPRVWCLV